MVSIYHKAFVNCNNLESIHLLYGEDLTIPPYALEALRNSMNENKNLKTLLTFIHFDKEFSSGVKFKLTELHLYHRRSGFSNAFLQTQRDCLESLLSDGTLNYYHWKTILLMKRLKKLDISSLPDAQIFILKNLRRNHSVIELKVASLYPDLRLKAVLRSFPKVQFLEIHGSFIITCDIANFIAETFVSLRKLFVDEFAATRIKNEDFYLKLEELKSKYLNATSLELFTRLKGEYECILPVLPKQQVS